MRVGLRLRSSDLARLAATSARAVAAAMGVVGENALADTEPFVPYETGALVGSGQAEAHRDRARLSWGNDADTAGYARAQYFEPHDHST